MEKTLKKYGAIFTGPTLIAFFIAFAIPFAMGLYLSFCEFTTVTNAKWVGLENYVKAFSARQGFGDAFIFTAIFTLAVPNPCLKLYMLLPIQADS